MKDLPCTQCGTLDRMIVAEGDSEGFFRGLGKKGKVRICDRCFEINETGEEPDPKRLGKRKLFTS